MNPGRDTPVLNSELAVRVMREIASRENGDYGSRIADELGRSQASIGRIIGELADTGFLEKGDRRKAQYYVIDYGFIGKYWYETIYSAVDELDEDSHRKKWLEEGVTSREEVLEGLEENRGKIEETVRDYVKQVLQDESVADSLTVSELLFESFAYSIGHNIIENPEFLEDKPFLEYPKDAMVFTLNVVGFPGRLREVVEG